jgi:hypothetical protein
VKQGLGRSYSFTETMGARKMSFIREKARGALINRGAELSSDSTPRQAPKYAPPKSAEKSRPVVKKTRMAVLPADV